MFSFTRIALFQTCRHIYAEARGFLCPLNVFNIHGDIDWTHPSFNVLLHPYILAVPEAHLCQIHARSVDSREVDWHFLDIPTKISLLTEGLDERNQEKSRSTTWTMHWRRVARNIPRLRTLFVRITVGNAYFGSEWIKGDEMHWAAPILQIRLTCRLATSWYVITVLTVGLSVTLQRQGSRTGSRWRICLLTKT